MPALADARLPDQRQRVANHVIGHRHLAHQPLQLEDFVGASGPARCDRTSVLVVRRAISNSSSKFGYLHEDLEHEAVLLRFGQRIGAFLLDRVLRGQHEERIARACAARGPP